MPTSIDTPQHRSLIKSIRGYRLAAGLTQLQLADRMGVYQSYVARLESGQRRVDVVEFIELSEHLNFDPVTLLAEIASIKP